MKMMSAQFKYDYLRTTPIQTVLEIEGDGKGTFVLQEFIFCPIYSIWIIFLPCTNTFFELFALFFAKLHCKNWTALGLFGLTHEGLDAFVSDNYYVPPINFYQDEEKLTNKQKTDQRPKNLSIHFSNMSTLDNGLTIWLLRVGDFYLDKFI